MLCAICKEIILNKKSPLLDEDGIILCVQHPTVVSLQSSANEGCHICSLVWARLAVAQQDYLLNLEADRDPITNVLMASPEALELQIEIFGADSLLLCPKFDVKDNFWDLPGANGEVTNMFVLQRSEVLRDFTLNDPSGDSTASDESWEIVKQWLEACISQHTRCSEVHNSLPWYPTRLIDIGESRVAISRLVVTSEETPDRPYVTLSHCWGRTNSLKLTLSSLLELRQHIPLADLSLTFREAFEVTRRLGIRYIWIDSLCIIQDSQDDWLHEAALMHKVYSKSYFTIAAAASSDSSQGLFRQRATHFLYPCEIQIPWYSNRPEAEYQLVDYTFWSSQIQDQPLHRRGWVVQERLLAPRVLHFSSQQLVWECHELDAAEKYPKGLPPLLSNTALSLFKGLDPERDGARLRMLSGNDPHPRFHAYQPWNKIANAYTSSMLSFGEDKLIALSGIAKRMQAELGDEYLAGLWKRFLPSQLLWHVDRCRQINNDPSCRPKTYRAPSWSWASVDGVISSGGFEDDGFIVEIIEASVTPATSDPTGLVESGFVRIRGVLKELKLERHEFLKNYCWMTVNGVQVRCQDDKEWERLGPLVHLDVDEPDLTGMKYCMPFREPAEYSTTVVGLILEATGNATGQFRRVGLFQAVQKELHPLILARNDNESYLPCESFDPETRAHTICIV